MKTYLVTYEGNSTRFKYFEEEVNANSAREAVEGVYSKYLDENYFPQDDGSVKDCDGHTIAEEDDDSIEYDGGGFGAQELTYDVVFSDNEASDEKGFYQSFDYCKDYINRFNGTNESYFADYKDGTVSIVCNETADTIFETKIK